MAAIDTYLLTKLSHRAKMYFEGFLFDYEITVGCMQKCNSYSMVLSLFRKVQIISKEKRPSKGKMWDLKSIQVLYSHEDWLKVGLIQCLHSLITVFLVCSVALMWRFVCSRNNFCFTEKKTWGIQYWLKFLTSLLEPDVSVRSLVCRERYMIWNVYLFHITTIHWILRVT